MDPAQLLDRCSGLPDQINVDGSAHGRFHHRGQLRPADLPVRGDGFPRRRTRDRYADQDERLDRDRLAQGHGGVTRTAKRRS